MSQIWSFLELEENRKILAWIGGGLAMAIAGLWTAIVHFSNKSKTPPSTPSVQASGGSVGVGGNVSGSTIAAANSGDRSEPKAGPKL